MKFITFIVFLILITTSYAEPLPGGYNMWDVGDEEPMEYQTCEHCGRTGADIEDTELARFTLFVREVEDWLAISTNTAMRAIVCRLSKHNMSLSALHRATGISTTDLHNATTKLMHMGLVRLVEVNHAGIVLAEYNSEAQKRIKKYASWCVSDDECGIEK